MANKYHVGLEHSDASLEDHDEHGVTWTTCCDCGAQWNAETGEQVSDGDETCLDRAE